MRACQEDAWRIPRVSLALLLVSPAFSCRTSLSVQHCACTQRRWCDFDGCDFDRCDCDGCGSVVVQLEVQLEVEGGIQAYCFVLRCTSLRVFLWEQVCWVGSTILSLVVGNAHSGGWNVAHVSGLANLPWSTAGR